MGSLQSQIHFYLVVKEGGGGGGRWGKLVIRDRGNPRAPPS